MRVPTPIVIILCLLAAVTAWLIGTRNKKFTTPPTPERLVAINKEWEQNRPNIPPPKPINTNTPDQSSENGSPTTPQHPDPGTRQQPEPIPTGNLDHSPSLAEYGTLGNKGSTAMINLATHLETSGQLQRSLLAWERVIDTTSPSDEERNQAVTSIKRLRASLPPWNPDPTADIALTLHAGATLKDEQALKEALTTAADLISRASGNTLTVNTRASIGKSRGIRTPRIPVAIWFSRPGKPPAETPPISFMTTPSQKQLLANQIEMGVYALIRSHLARETQFTPLPEYPPEVKPDDLLQHHVTRLMWREFVRSMKE